jgi:hypothetical protein
MPSVLPYPSSIACPEESSEAVRAVAPLTPM